MEQNRNLCRHVIQLRKLTRPCAFILSSRSLGPYSYSVTVATRTVKAAQMWAQVAVQEFRSPIWREAQVTQAQRALAAARRQAHRLGVRRPKWILRRPILMQLWWARAKVRGSIQRARAVQLRTAHIISSRVRSTARRRCRAASLESSTFTAIPPRCFGRGSRPPTGVPVVDRSPRPPHRSTLPRLRPATEDPTPHFAVDPLATRRPRRALRSSLVRWSTASPGSSPEGAHGICRHVPSSG